MVIHAILNMKKLILINNNKIQSLNNKNFSRDQIYLRIKFFKIKIIKIKIFKIKIFKIKILLIMYLINKMDHNKIKIII